MTRFRLVIVILLCYMGSTNDISAQSYIHVQGNMNYWEHTDLYGLGIGLGYSYKINKVHFAFKYDFGYGTKDRFKDMDNINYDNWTTVFLKNRSDKWDKDYLGWTGNYSNELKATSDYAKQHQIALQIGYTLFDKNGMELVLSTGFYTAIVEHFYTYTNVPIHYLELPSVYRGPLNYIPSTSQKVYTYGGNVEIALNKLKGSKIISPYLSAGLGPKHGSYLSAGLRLSTQVLKK